MLNAKNIEIMHIVLGLWEPSHHTTLLQWAD